MSPTTAAFVPATAPEFPRHVVTAVLVSHDGARWLPDALAGLLGQERPVQNVIAADTGSADESARLLTEALGDERVLHLARRSGFGTAVDEAVSTAGVLTPDDLPYLKRPSGWDPVTRTWRDETYDLPELPHGEPVQWLWLLHDDCAPAPDALAELLRVADSDEYAAIVGPKLRGWYDRKQLLEVGVSIANSGRRWTGLDRREQDQGQHDQVRTVLSVSSAGMLIRRDVWEELGGFDRRLPLMRDDVDLCWRAHAAGHRVLVAPEAVMRHAEAAARERRTGRLRGPLRPSTRTVSTRPAPSTRCSSTRGPPSSPTYCSVSSSEPCCARSPTWWARRRARPSTKSWDSRHPAAAGPDPRRQQAAGQRRGRGGRTAPAVPAVRRDGPDHGRADRQRYRRPRRRRAAAVGGTAPSRSGPGGDDADFLEIEQFARLKSVAAKPGPYSSPSCWSSRSSPAADSSAAARSGGALLPAPAGRLRPLGHGTRTAGIPSVRAASQSAPPYMAVLALFAALFLGSTGLTLTLLLVCSVPLAGISAYFASRPLVESRLLRAWATVAYAFLPAATGALATGRLGTAVLAILLPLMARAAVASSGSAATRRDAAAPGWRATWAYALMLSFTMAFTPVMWPMAVCSAAAPWCRGRRDLAPVPARFPAPLGHPDRPAGPLVAVAAQRPEPGAATRRDCGTVGGVSGSICW